MGATKVIALKEVRHILRDSRSLTMAIALPMLMTLLFGYAINLDVKNVRLAIIDSDRTAESRDLVGRFYNSGYFVRPAAAVDPTDPERILKKGDADAILTVRPGFAAALTNLTGYQVGLLVDGADANLAAAATNYASIIVARFGEEWLPSGIEIPRVVISTKILYNPNLKSANFFVPGIIAIILMVISAMLTSITIAREKETGTMEQLLVSPITPGQVIVGKVLPYIALAFLDAVLVIAFAVFHFGVPFVGSAALLALFGFIYIAAALSAGILISTLVSTQQVAMMSAQLLTILPSVMLSGFIFDLRNMPRVLQYVSYIVPARYFQLIIRGIMLKGAGIGVLWIQGVFLAALTLILLGVAARKFRLKMG
ncbi:MAG: ABC transporter permease [Candidatus Eisenbacteria bacterium]